MFNKQVKLAVALLECLTHTPQSTKKLAIDIETTEFFLQQIVTKLRKQGLVNIKRGPKGGVFKASTSVQLFQIMSALNNLNHPSCNLETKFVEFAKNYQVN